MSNAHYSNAANKSSARRTRTRIKQQNKDQTVRNNNLSGKGYPKLPRNTLACWDFQVAASTAQLSEVPWADNSTSMPAIRGFVHDPLCLKSRLTICLNRTQAAIKYWLYNCRRLSVSLREVRQTQPNWKTSRIQTRAGNKSLLRLQCMNDTASGS